MNQDRVNRLVTQARSEGLEAMVIMPGPNMFYLTGLEMHLSERPALLFFPVTGEPFAVCPAFEVERIAHRAGITKVFPWGEEEGPAPVLQRAMAEMGLGRGTLGVEFRYMRVLERELLAGAVVGGTLQYIDGGVICANLRMQKDAKELAVMQQAAALADAAVKAAHSFIKPGVTEQQVAAYIGQEMQKLGVEPPYDIYVASGPRAAIPHAGPTERVIKDGELVWVDYVCHHDGYVGDITRTFAVGKVTGTLAEIFQVCHDAQAKVRAEARPGMTGAQIDAIARDYITGKGYGPYFTHRTGHGLGLEVHEEPYIVGSNHRPLAVGNAFTIEPGIYIPEVGGVRIEDDVIMEENGLRTLTSYPRNLLT